MTCLSPLPGGLPPGPAASAPRAGGPPQGGPPGAAPRGVGEQVDDLQEFNAKDFCRALVGESN